MSVITQDQLDKKELNKRVINLAWPAVSRMFLQSVVGMVDIMMVGRLGPSSIAAVSLGNRLVFIMIGALQALAVGSTALVAQYIGANNRKQANRVIWQALYGAFLLAVLLSIGGYLLTPQILTGMLSLMETMDYAVLDQGIIYLRIIFISMIFGLPQICINALLQGVGDMKTPLYIMTISNLCNVIGNYLLIFGVGPFPELGVTGAAIATGGSRVIGALVGLVILFRGKSKIRLRVAHMPRGLNKQVLARILKIGLPASVEQLIRHSTQIIFTFLVAGLGTMAIAANEIVMNVQSISQMPGFGFSLAATTLVGQSLGAEKYRLAQDYGAQTMKITMFLMGSLGLVLVIWPQAFIHLYTDDPRVIQAAIPSLRIIAGIQPIFAVLMVLSGALRGAGDTKWVMYTTFIGNWGVRVVLSLMMAFYFRIGLMGFWIAVALDISVRSLLIYIRFRAGHWKVRVIDTPAPKSVKSISV